MKHARLDYNRIQDPALSDPGLLAPGSTAIGIDEPVMLFRAQDVFFIDILLKYAELLQGAGRHQTTQLVMQNIAVTEKWRETHAVKMPDVPGFDERPPDAGSQFPVVINGKEFKTLAELTSYTEILHDEVIAALAKQKAVYDIGVMIGPDFVPNMHKVAERIKAWEASDDGKRFLSEAGAHAPEVADSGLYVQTAKPGEIMR